MCVCKQCYFPSDHCISLHQWFCQNQSTDDSDGSRIMAGHAYVPKDAQPDRSTTDTGVESEIEGIEKEDLPNQPPPPEERHKEGESEPLWGLQVLPD